MDGATKILLIQPNIILSEHSKKNISSNKTVWFFQKKNLVE